MRSMSAHARATMSKRKNFVNYATVTLSNGTVLNLKPSDFRISGNSFTDDFVDSDDFAIGTVLGKTCTLVLDNTSGRKETVSGTEVEYKNGKFSEYDFYMSYFYLYVKLPDADVDSNGKVIDWTGQIGKFTVTEPGSTGSVIEITGVDEMYKFDKSFDDFTWSTTGMTLYSLLTQCCTNCGVSIGFDNTFDNATYSITCDKPEGVTYRQVVSYILQIAGYNGRISNMGAFQLVWYDMSKFGTDTDGGTFSHPTSTVWGDGATLDGGTFSPWNTGDVYDAGDFSTNRQYHIVNSTKGLTVSTDDIKFTGVKVVNQESEIEVTYGTNAYVMEIKDNALLNGKDRTALTTLATHIYNKINSVYIRPFSCDVVQNPTIEPGDCIMLWDVKGNAFKSVITNVTYTTGGYTSISCKAKSPTAQASTFVNPSAQAVVEARRNTQKQINSYSEKVQQFNELANNSLGYYTTQTVEEGATVTYIHDQPKLSDSTIIWKQTASGWFISQDGGQSYTGGVDASTATMLMNLIYVHGLTADWIETGDLTIGGKDGNKDGSIVIKNSSGAEIGKWNKDGLTIKQPNGTEIMTVNSSGGTFKGKLNAASGTMSDGTGTLSLAGGSLYMKNSETNGPGVFSQKTDGSVYACWGATNSAAQIDNKYLEVRTYDIIDTTRTLGPYKNTLKSMAEGSDKRLKKDIKDLDGELAYNLIMSVKPKEYKFKDHPDELNFGVVAQDIRDIEDTIGLDKEHTRLCYTREHDNMYGVQYDQFIAPMISVIQSQQKEIDALKELVNKLIEK